MYKTVRQLNPEQLSQLKQAYLFETSHFVTYEDIADADKIPDKVIFDFYDGVNFTDDDFFD